MSQFDNTLSRGDNTFIKTKPEMLNNFYGTTDIFPYWVADMDFQVAQPITQELDRLVKRGVFAYEFNEEGIFSAISHWYSTRHQVELSEKNFVQVPGVLSGIALFRYFMCIDQIDYGQNLLILCHYKISKFDIAYLICRK